MIKDILKINDVQSKCLSRPLISLTESSGLHNKWLFDTGAAITCMSIGSFRKIPLNKRPKKSMTKGKYVRERQGQV